MVKWKSGRRKMWVVQLFIALITILLAVDATAPERSCRDHYLNGQFENSVLPLTYGSSRKNFRVECQFPDHGGQSRRSVTTIIHSGLEQWLFLNSSEKRTVAYQVGDWEFLREIVTESKSCSQNLFIDWGTALQSEEAESRFYVETLNGFRHTFRQNQSDAAGRRRFEVARLKSAPAVHLIPDRGTVTIRASPLSCRRTVIPRRECLFEMLNGGESLRIDVNGVNGEEPQILRFSFRTGHPNTPFFSVQTSSGKIIRIDLIDGYLIKVNHIIHPIGLLADGNWHRITIDLVMFAVTVDSSATVISLRTSLTDDNGDAFSSSDPIRKIDVLIINGMVTAVQILPQRDFRRESNWLCDKRFVSLRRSAPYAAPFSPSMISTALDEKICVLGKTTTSYCNCRAPNSVLHLNHARSQPATCGAETGKNALHFRRVADKLAFLFIPGLPLHSTLSILFKSELENGLLLFGISFGAPSRSSTENEAQSSRVQVHFAGKNIAAVVCNRLNANGVERCYSCFIHRPNGFVTDEWLRVSLFSYEVYQFMALNEQICHLSPNSVVSDASELYKVSSSFGNALFVGGMYYAKHFQLNRLVNDTLRRQLQDNTREKPFSFQGCISEIRINGAKQNMNELLNQQRAFFAKSIGDAPAIFSVSDDGTCSAKCPWECNGAPCRPISPTVGDYNRYSSDGDSDNDGSDPIDVRCDCAAVYRRNIGHTKGACERDERELINDWTSHRKVKIIESSAENSMERESPRDMLPFDVLPSANAAILLSSAQPFVLAVPLTVDVSNSALGGVMRHRIIDKIWLLLGFPTGSSSEHMLLQIGAIQINVADYGRKVIVDIEEYEIQEVFQVDGMVDNRLHLLAIELNNAKDSANRRRFISVRLDSEIRVIDGFERIPFFPASDPVKLTPVPRTSSNDNETGQNLLESGCLAEFMVSFKKPDDESWMPSAKFEEETLEKDYLERVIQAAINSPNDVTHKGPKSLIASDCGIRDPTLWFQNSSAWGLVGDYDPNTVTSNQNDRAMSLFSLVLTLALVLLLFLLIYCYCYMRFKREKKRLPVGSHYKANIASKPTHFDKYSLSDDKRPLKSESLFFDSSRNSSSSPRSPTQEMESPELHYSNGSGIHGTPLRVATAAPVSNYIIVREDPRIASSPYNDFVIDEYSSSPKLAARRHRSKAAILLRRPPDPPQYPLQISLPPPQRHYPDSSTMSSQRSLTLPPSATATAAVAAAHAVTTPSSACSSSNVGLSAPIASQEDEAD